MVFVTLIGEKQTKVGNEFVYTGFLSECKDCRLKGVCFNLEEGKRYRITAVRSIHHDCKIHEEGVRVVEVEKLPIHSAMSARLALEGAVVSLEQRACSNLECKHYRLCNPYGIKLEDKFKILKVGDEIECVLGEKLREVSLG